MKLYSSNFVFIVLLITCLSVSAQFSNRVLLPVEVKGKWGYINSDGEIVIEPRYSYAGKFSDGLAPVRINNNENEKEKYGYINLSGEVVIPFQFEDAKEFSEGLAVVRINQKYGYVNTEGRIVVEPLFKKAWKFSNGMGRVLQDVTEKGADLYGFVDKSGKIAIKPQYVFALDFHEDLAGFAVEVGEKLKMGFLNKEGKVVIKPTFNVVGDFSEGLAVVSKKAKSYIFEGNIFIDEEKSKNRKVFYINKDGNIEIRGNFQTASSFSEGLAVVEIKNKSGFIDKSGKIVISLNFPANAEVRNFSEGLAAVNFMNGAKFINKVGEIIIDTEFNWADDFSNGFARVKRIGTNGSEKYGYINRSGKLIWNPDN